MHLATTYGTGTRKGFPGTPAALALALVAVAALSSGCNAAHHTTATAASGSPTAEASLPAGDATATVVEPSAAPSAITVPSTGPAAISTGTTPGSAPGVDPSVPQAASRGTGRTTPGIADGATALPATAAVAPDTRCRTSSLRLEPVDLQGSPGGTYANFRLLNVGRSSCAVRGFVGATLIGDDGRDIATTVRHEAGPEVWVTVAPKGSAQFHLRFPNPYSGDSPCSPPNAAKLRVTLASATGQLVGATPEGGIQACDGAVSTAPVGST